MLNVIMLSVIMPSDKNAQIAINLSVDIFIGQYNVCHKAKRHYAECHHMECHYAWWLINIECHNVECHYA